MTSTHPWVCTSVCVCVYSVYLCFYVFYVLCFSLFIWAKLPEINCDDVMMIRHDSDGTAADCCRDLYWPAYTLWKHFRNVADSCLSISRFVLLPRVSMQLGGLLVRS